MSLIKYSSPLVKGKEIYLDEDFAKEVDKLVDIGTPLGITIYFNSGFRLNSNNLHGATVDPAKMSNHFTGTGFDGNLIHRGKFYTSKKLEGALPDEIIFFIDAWKILGNRWGGDFKKRDVVHFDNGLNLKNPEKWKELYKEYHV